MSRRWLKLIAVVSCIFVVFVHLLFDLTRNIQEQYALREVLHLEEARREAHLSDVRQAANILRHVSAKGPAAKQSKGSSLDQICSLQQSNVINDIIAYLRDKSGEDLGPIPEPWIDKYATKH